MIVLGIETSTAVCAVGLVRDGKKAIERSLVESHIHSEKLLTLVQEVIAEAAISLKQIDCIAVSIGPGSFTGLRIGLSTTKGLCYALEKPLVAIPTFDGFAKAAFDAHPNVNNIVVMLDAKKSEYYVGQFERRAGAIKLISEIEVLSFTQAVSYVTGDARLVITDRAEEIKQLAGKSIMVEDVHQYCCASVVATIGIEKALRGDFAQLTSLEPMYLKDFVVQMPA